MDSIFKNLPDENLVRIQDFVKTADSNAVRDMKNELLDAIQALSYFPARCADYNIVVLEHLLRTIDMVAYRHDPDGDGMTPEEQGVFDAALRAVTSLRCKGGSLEPILGLLCRILAQAYCYDFSVIRQVLLLLKATPQFEAAGDVLIALLFCSSQLAKIQDEGDALELRLKVLATAEEIAVAAVK